MAFVVLAAFRIFTLLFERSPFFTGTDLGVWRADWMKLSKCLEAGTFPCTVMSKFPAGYLLNSYYLSAMEAHGFERPWALGLVNTIFLALPIAFIVVATGVRSSLSRSLIYVVALFLTAVPAFYVYSGALEVQSGVLIGIFISCLVLIGDDLEQPRRSLLSIVLFITALLLPLFKDTNISILCVGLAVAVVRTWLGKGNYAAVWSLLVAVILGLGCSMTYNFIKYGSVLPLPYLEEATQSPPPAKMVEFFAATYLSPNGGVIVFWACALCALVWLLRGFQLEVSPAGASVAVVVVLINSAILAGWWAPFGWDTWGDRLMIPAMLALVICLAATARGRRVERPPAPAGFRLGRVLRNSALAGVVVLSLHFTFVSNRARPDAIFRTAMFGGPMCQQMLRDLQANATTAGLSFWRSDSYYACARERFMHVPRYISNKR